MTPGEFVRGRPCLDEIEGYRDALKLLGIEYSTEEIAPLMHWERSLTQGKDLPARRDLPDQTWRYQRNRKPVKRRTHAV